MYKVYYFTENGDLANTIFYYTKDEVMLYYFNNLNFAYAYNKMDGKIITRGK